MSMDNLSPQLARQLFEACPSGILALDREGRISWVNRALENLLGMPRAALLGCDADSLPHPGLSALLDGTPQAVVENTDGVSLHLSRSRMVPPDSSDDIAEVHFFTDRGEEHKLRQRLESQQLSDEDTGLMNPRALMLVLEPQISRSRRYGNPLSIAVLDLHQDVGEESGEHLRNIALLLKDRLRWADMVGRDEDGRFVLVLPETPLAAAQTIVKKLQSGLDALLSDSQFRFGVAEWRKPDDVTSLLQRAAATAAGEVADAMSAAR
jgi:diguanylate cyclase (GGDEF)-like protein